MTSPHSSRGEIADAGLNFAGSAGNAWDDYSFCVVDQTIFGLRSFSDKPHYVRAFQRNLAFGLRSGPIDFQAIVQTIDAAVGAANQVQFGLHKANVLLGTYDSGHFIYLFTVGPPPLPPAEVPPTEGSDAAISYPPKTYITKVRQLKPHPRPPFNEYRVGDFRSSFPVTFRVFEQADLRVTVDGLETFAVRVHLHRKCTPVPGWDDADAILADPDFIEENNAFPAMTAAD